MKLKVLDVVLTRYGTVTVVDRVDREGRVSIVLPEWSKQKSAWYEPKELKLVGSLSSVSAAAVHKMKEPW